MEAIKEKIRNSKLGGKNPNATGVKCKNIYTNEEYFFDSQAEMKVFFNENNHQFISRRCQKIIKCLYKEEWLIAYTNENYPDIYFEKGKTPKKGTQIKVTNKETLETKTFNSLRELEREMPELPSR